MPVCKTKPQCGAINEPRWKTYGCLALLLVGLYLVMGQRLSLSRWHVSAAGTHLAGPNAALDEALQWRRGSLALSQPFYEDAVYHGASYNVVGLGFVLVSLVGTSLTSIGGGSVAFSPALYVLFVAIPIPLIGFWAFRTVVRSSSWAAVLTAYLVAGTCLGPVLALCRGGGIYYVNHALATVGLLVMAADLLGERRIWPAVAGLCLAAWSRQLTGLYALPLLWIAAMPRPARPCEQSAKAADDAIPAVDLGKSQARRRRIVVAAVGIALAAALPLTLNALKFGDPFDTGYRRLYEGRTDAIAKRANEALFSPRYLGMHAKAMNLAFPAWDIRQGTLFADTSDIDGGSIWLASPLLLGVVVTAPSWWRDRRRRVLLLSTLPVIAGLMCYHTTGSQGAGYYRYALDFIPIWLMVMAPHVISQRAAPLTIACLAYSALYHALLAH